MVLIDIYCMSTSGKVRKYINKNPTLLISLRKNLLNYSSLTRLILKDLKMNKRDFDAVLVACRRYAKEISSDETGEKVIQEVLQNAQLKIRTGLCRIVLNIHTHLSDNIVPVHFVKGNSSITIIAEDEDYEELRRTYEHNILDSNRELAEVAIISDRKAGKIPGITAHLSNIISNKGVNVETALFGHKDGVFIINQEDLNKILDVFNKP